MINVRDYWPTRSLLLEYTDAGSNVQFVTRFRPTLDGFLYEDFDAAGRWMNTWYMQHTERGLIEWRDDEAVAGLAAIALGPTKKLVFKPGREIVWGGRQRVGDTIAAQVEIDHFRSNMLPPFKGSWSYGWQSVHFTAHHDTFTTIRGDTFPDVLQFDYIQPWGAKIAGARYFNAKGIGPVQVEWLARINGDAVFSPPVAAAPVFL